MKGERPYRIEYQIADEEACMRRFLRAYQELAEQYMYQCNENGEGTIDISKA